MSGDVDREELVRLVAFIMSAEGTKAELDAALAELERRVVHPHVSDLIFWPQAEGHDHELSAEEVVDAALAYKPIAL